MIIKPTIAIIFLCLLSACGTYQASTQTDNSSYIQLSGDTSKVEIIIDGNNIGKLDNFQKFNLEGGEVTRFELEPGVHVVEALRSGKTILKRKIFITEGNVFEVRLP
jgi:hypothetical protein